MKKTLLFIFTILVAFSGFSQLSEDFESGTFPPAGWTTFVGTNGLGTVQSWAEEGTSNHYAKVFWETVTTGSTSEDWLVSSQFTVDTTTPILKFDNVVFNTADYGGVLTIRISTASQTTHADFATVDSQTETDIRNGATSTFLETRAVDLSSFIGQTIYIAFVWEQNNSDKVAIDNIRMVASIINIPIAATNPNPADSAPNVTIDTANSNRVQISWDAVETGDAAAESYDLYLGTDPASLTLANNFTGRVINWSSRDYSTTYYWQIVPKNTIGDAINNPIWSFTTQADPTASVEDDKLVSSVIIYPSTVDNEFTIKNESNIALTNVVVYDINGRVVLQENLDNLIGSKSINASNLSSGMYFVEVNSADGRLTKKIIKK